MRSGKRHGGQINEADKKLGRRRGDQEGGTEQSEGEGQRGQGRLKQSGGRKLAGGHPEGRAVTVHR